MWSWCSSCGGGYEECGLQAIKTLRFTEVCSDKVEGSHPLPPSTQKSAWAPASLNESPRNSASSDLRTPCSLVLTESLNGLQIYACHCSVLLYHSNELWTVSMLNVSHVALDWTQQSRCLPSPEDGSRSSFQNVCVFSYFESGRWTKSKNPVSLCVIHHRQNPTASRIITFGILMSSVL
jgi:hypothetical protein